MTVSYQVPGVIPAIRQPSNLVCWAAAYTIIRSWRDNTFYAIRDSVALVDSRYGEMVDLNEPMRSTAFARFLQEAGMGHDPMWNLPITGWRNLLQRRGLLWVGALNSLGPGAGLHSRIVEGIHGGGNAGDTNMKIVDPAGGRRYDELFSVFLQKYEGGYLRSQPRGGYREYFQIRYLVR